MHRVGQERPVYVQRLVIKNSVENRILEIQRLKQNLADGILGAGGDISISSKSEYVTRGIYVANLAVAKPGLCRILLLVS